MAGIHIDRQAEFERDGLLGYRLRNNSGGTVNAGEVVIFDTTVQGGDAFTTTTTADDPLVIGMLVDTVANGAYGFVAIMGHVTTLKVNGTTDISVGNYLTTHTVAGIAAKQTSAPKGGVFAIALEAYSTNDSSGVIDAWLWPAGRTDASGNTLTYGNAGQMAADGVAAANNAGATAAVARIDHVHTNTADTPALTLSTTNSAGTAGSVLAADATIAAFDATVPGTIVPDTSAATGSAGTAARRDHTHGIAAAAPSASGSLVAAGSAAEGVSTSFARADHAHPLLILDDVDITFGTDSDIALGHSTANTTSNVDDLVLGLGDTNRALHITSDTDKGTDFAVAADSNPSVYIHSETTPATDYLKLFHDATDANVNSVGGSLNIDVPTGENVTIQINNVDEVVFDATSLSPATNDGNQLGTTALGWADLFLAAGGVINWANGEVTLTEAANSLTMDGGDLLVANGNGAVVGHSAQITFNALVPELQVLGDTVGVDGALAVALYSATAGQGPEVILARSKSGTLGTNTIVAANDSLGRILAVGADGGTGFDPAASIEFFVDGTPGAATDMPGRIVFLTSPDGSQTPTEVFRVSADQNMYVANANGVVIGAQAQYTIGGTGVPEFQVVGTGAEDAAVAIGRWGANANAAALDFVKSRDAAIGSFTIVQSGDIIGAITAYGDDGVDYTAAASAIYFAVDGTPGVGDMPGRITFLTSTDGGETLTERMRISNAGVISTWDGVNLRVGGTNAHSTPGTNSASFMQGTNPSGAATTTSSICANATVLRKIIADGTASNIET